MSSQIVEWRLMWSEYLFWYWDSLSGPHPVASPSGRRGFEDKLFDLKEVNLADWPKVADAAIARAGLKDKSGVSIIEIARQNAFLPGSASKALRWSIVVKSAREQARVIADAKGEILKVNLNASRRPPDFNMLQRPELIVEAVAELREHLVQRDGRVRQGAAGHAAVGRDAGRRHLHRHRHDAAKRVGDARQPDLDVLGVADHDHV